MKKKVWNTSNVVGGPRSTGPYIGINPKSGFLRISPGLMNLLKTKKVNFVQDESRPEDWFLEPSMDPAAFEIRVVKNSSGGIIQSTVLAREILTSSKLPNETCKVIVAGEALKAPGAMTGCFAIITKSAK